MTATILDFVASLANTLAWPIVVIALALIFRDEVAHILSALQQRIKHLRRATGPGNTSVEFDQFAEEADVAALELSERVEPQPDQVNGGPPPATDEYQLPYFLDEARRNALTVESPVAGLLVGYAELETQLRTYFKDTGLSEGSSRAARFAPVRMAESLMTERLLPTGFTEVLRPVAAARNALAHGQVPERQDRAELRDLVEHCADLAEIVFMCRARYSNDPDARFPERDSDE